MPTINLGRKKPRERTYNKEAYQDVYNTPRWKRLRARKVRENPLCEECLRKGVITQVEEVHHVRPFDINDPEGTGAYNYDNLVSLCIPCHKAAHMRLNRI